MKRSGVLLLGAIFFLSSWSGFAEEKDKEWRKLERGAIIIKTQKDPRTRDRVSIGKILLPASREVVWEILTDYQSYPQFFPKIKQVKVFRREGNQVWLDLTFSNLLLFSDFKARMVYDENPAQMLLSYKIEQGDFKKFYGSWKLTSVNNTRTLVESRLYQYVGWWWFPFIPASVFNNSLLYDQLNALRKQVQKFQLENGSKPEEVIKPHWRKSRYKELEEKEAKPKKEE